MEASNQGSSIYHRLHGLFQSCSEGELEFATRQPIEDSWGLIRSALNNPETPRIQEPVTGTCCFVASMSTPLLGKISIYHTTKPETLKMVGLILAYDESTSHVFENFFVATLLSKLNFCLEPHVLASNKFFEVTALTASIVNLFDSRLRYAGVNDQWNAVGRSYFTGRLLHFVSRGATLEFCLPAFPCKSSNTDKVLGVLPDRGEAMALEWLHSFLASVEDIYPPGAKLWIVSDGHVFSDCIGADDGVVDSYTARLRNLNDEIGKQNADRITFTSLVDLFSLFSSRVPLPQLAEKLHLPEISHHFDTELTVEAELCRRILMAGSHASRDAVRQRINGQDRAVLALYRGFSKFMLEDLALHPATRGMTKSKRRKLATAVSFEMIMRNQAYSNLVEMVFPNHIRLSIHAHPNTGPKFGIVLFDRNKVRATAALSAQSVSLLQHTQPCSSDLLHIPTPWHNCVVEVSPPPSKKEHEPIFLVTKAMVVRMAIERGDFVGRLEGSELRRCWSGRVCGDGMMDDESEDREQGSPCEESDGSLAQGTESKTTVEIGDGKALEAVDGGKRSGELMVVNHEEDVGVERDDKKLPSKFSGRLRLKCWGIGEFRVFWRVKVLRRRQHGIRTAT